MITNKKMIIKSTLLLFLILTFFSDYCADRSATVNMTIAKLFNETSIDTKTLIANQVNIQNKINIIEPTQEGAGYILNSIKDLIPTYTIPNSEKIKTQMLLIAGASLACTHIILNNSCGYEAPTLSAEAIAKIITSAAPFLLQGAQAGAALAVSSNIINSNQWLSKIYTSSIAIISLNAIAPTDQLVDNLIGNVTLNVAGSLLQKSGAVQNKISSVSEKIKSTDKPSPLIMGSVIVGGVTLASLYFYNNLDIQYISNCIPIMMNIAEQAIVYSMGQKLGKWAFGK